MRSRRFVVCAMALMMVVGALSTISFVATAQDGEETVYIAMQQDMPNFNYFDLASNTVWKDYVIGKFCFESLSGLDPAGNLFPALAESWEFDDTVTPYQVNVTLRQGVLFHDGTEMTADDVVFSYMALRDGTTLSSSIIDAFDADNDGVASAAEVDGDQDADANGEYEGVKKIDDYNVTFVMAKPYGQFFLTTLGIAILPEHVWTDHVDGEGRMDTLWSHEDATTGTGPFYYQEGEQDVYRIMTRFDDYWGPDVTTTSGHRLYPEHVKHIHYKLYSSLDTAILALKSRQVDHLPWTVTPGYVPDLAEDPNVDLRFVSDNGYFYLAFNMKREPMNNIHFRKAVSYAIDKDTIVNRYMGGYGRAGDSSEPPFWSDWYNDSVETYPFDPALTDAMTSLTTGGFTLQGGTLYKPDGKPVPELVVLTPPADYDPIRIKAGELIAKNLRSLGINVIAKPLDFDALVAKMNAFDYDMLIIGWSLSSDPIGNVFDILGPKATQNYFGFWSTTNDNPLYNTLGGVSTLADAQTQYLADLTQQYADLAKASFDRNEQILWTKAGQGVVADALPVNVLYYRVNIYAVSTAWESSTWVNYLGELLNVYTMGELTPLGEEEVAGEQVTAMLFAPDKILIGTDMNASVLVVDGAGAPLEGADVTLAPSANLTLSATSGATDADGVFEFTISAASEGYHSLDATGASGGNDFTYSKTIQSVKGVPNILFLDVTPELNFLRVGESTVVHMNVTDGYGNAVEGASIELDKGLMGYGSIDPVTGTVLTDTNGYGTMTYSAPADLSQALNKHLQVRLSLTATKSGYLTTNANTWTQFVTIYNPTANDWQFVEVQTVTDYAMDAGSNTSTVTIHAFDMGGNINNGMIQITYTNEDVLFDPVTDVVTNGAGLASFDVQFLDGIDTNATRITFQNETVPNSVAASLTLLYKGVTIPTPELYGGLISFATTPLLDPNGAGTLDFDVSLYDIDGNVPVGVTDATIVIGEPPLGVVAGLDMTAPESYNALWDYAGLQLATMYDDSGIISGGYFRADLMSDAEIAALNPGMYGSWQDLYDDDWIFLGEKYFGLSTVNHTTMVGADINNGVGTFTINSVDMVLGDSVPHILVVPNGKMGFLVTPDYSNFYYLLQGPSTLSTEFATARAMSIISTTMTLDNPVMRSLGTGNTSNVDVSVFDQDNNPVVGAQVAVYVQVYGGSPFFSVGTVPDTDATGSTSTVIEGLTEDGDGNPLSNPAKQPLYANPTYPGHATLFVSSEIFVVPIQLFVLLDPSDVSFEAGAVTLEATVTDEYGNPVEGFDVEFIADNGTLDPETAATTGGLATSEFEFLLPSGFRVASLSASVVKAGYIAAVNSIRIGVFNTPGVIDVTSVPISGHVSEDGSISIEGTATEPTGIDTFQIILDGGTPVDVTVGADGSFSHEFTDLEEGDHTAVIQMVDSAGATTETTIIFEVKKEAAEEFPWLWIIVAIILIIVIILLVMVARRRAAPLEPEEEEMIEEEAPAEEALEEASEDEPLSEEPPSEEDESLSVE